MSEYTKGPWSLETVPTTAGSCHKIGPFPSIGVRPQVHACVYADGIRIGRDEKLPVAVELLANARLIAAAPELLEALVLITDNIEQAFPGLSGLGPITQARAAIAKAISVAAPSAPIR